MDNPVKVFVRSDGLTRVEIYARNSPPTFGFCEQIWKEYEHPLGELYSYWSEVRSGTNFYESAEAAEADARAMFPWIADANSS
jgi:hypothetical protein